MSSLLTTCIGAHPKPDFVRIPDWFGGPEGPDAQDPTGAWAGAMREMGASVEAVLSRGCAQVIEEQEQAGIDILTDGEVPRENYIHYHCRALLESFRETTVILGVVAAAKSRLESVEEIRARLDAALQHIDAARLVAAPDCGLGLLARAKLRHLCEAAHVV